MQLNQLKYSKLLFLLSQNHTSLIQHHSTRIFFNPCNLRNLWIAISGYQVLQLYPIQSYLFKFASNFSFITTYPVLIKLQLFITPFWRDFWHDDIKLSFSYQLSCHFGSTIGTFHKYKTSLLTNGYKFYHFVISYLVDLPVSIRQISPKSENRLKWFKAVLFGMLQAAA